MRFAIKYDRITRTVFTPFRLGPRHSWIDVGDDEVQVRLAWGFRVAIPRSSITSVAPTTRRVFDRGVHGWRGRWIVNGARTGLLDLHLDPPARARTLLGGVNVTCLTVSLDEPDRFREVLAVA
jgi:hypothetical protein